MDFKHIKDELKENDRDVIGRMLYDALSFNNQNNIYKKVPKQDNTNTITVGISEQSIIDMVELVNRSNIYMTVTDIKIIE